MIRHLKVEDLMFLDELSKTTLADYIKKSSAHVKDLGDQHHISKAVASYNYDTAIKSKNKAITKNHNELGDLFGDAARDLHSKQDRRVKGIATAVGKLFKK